MLRRDDRDSYNKVVKKNYSDEAAEEKNGIMCNDSQKIV
ncbi:MAG: Hypothetical protein LKU_00239 [Lactobacillus kefiranofaciens]|nr:hypothetical protein WANG_1800 [Lactobacillus kefiranofaciens subsp. kefiranofaciens]